MNAKTLATMSNAQDMQLLMCIQQIARLPDKTQEQITRVLSGMCIMAQMEQTESNTTPS